MTLKVNLRMTSTIEGCDAGVYLNSHLYILIMYLNACDRIIVLIDIENTTVKIATI